MRKIYIKLVQYTLRTLYFLYKILPPFFFCNNNREIERKTDGKALITSSNNSCLEANEEKV